ncbi:MAG: 30S ribosomal protein S3, partial [Candidatus Heimdallarchaeota archaeon]
MSSTKYFVQNGREFVNIDEYLAKELDRAGYGKVELHKTPLGHRVIIHAMRLGMVIGKSGKNIKRLTEDLEDMFGLESPQLEVKELENPDLVSRVQASKLMSQIERGFHFRRAGHSLLRRITTAGARGAEIIISGKLSSQRSRQEAFRAGFVAKAGHPAQAYVDEYVSSTALKQGTIGIKVRIMSPSADLPDEPIFYDTPFADETDTDLEISEPSDNDTELEQGEIEEIFTDEENSSDEIIEDKPVDTPQDKPVDTPQDKPVDTPQDKP